MTISPVAIGVGSGAVAALGLGSGAAWIMNGIGDRHPTGSDADGKARGVQWGLAGLGIVAGFGGMAAFWHGNPGLGAGLLGGGVGAVAGSIGAAVSFGHTHGVGVDTSVNDVMRAYNRDFDDELDLDTTWRMPEDVRRTENRHEDGDGRVWYTYDYHTIDRLASKADVDRNMKVTRPELRDAIDSYDADGNGRIQGEEVARLDREVGERSWYGRWF